MAAMPDLSSLNTPAGMGKLNGFMSSRSYVSGFEPSQEDVKLVKALEGVEVDQKKAAHVARFLKHMNDFSESERSAWPEAGAAAAGGAAEEEDDDDFDLFGDDDEEAEKALAEKMAAEKAARKAGKGKGERSLIVLEVKPYDAETDLEVLAKGIKKFEHEGIQNWGKEHKLLPVAFGIKKLAISAVVYDDLMGVDGLSDLIEEKYGDLIQSIDVQAMSKV
ncbi:Elongation factor 1-beta [Hondaea fermentalgiana]|uniref:Elongation factor 1-beta n=1 Tax=Hondaea fermentalgiana TaxID=2315210 RepID=A0A2R5G001_9STRA|nr:Elongation factor 1-beta [Hondaea fermentalgiana]|eukprot:GBG24342.1 Elongation factor 1-beta [Hondaea fermentalgiana]